MKKEIAVEEFWLLLCKWPFQRRFCENSGRGGGIWSPLCPNGCFGEVFVKIAVVE